MSSFFSSLVESYGQQMLKKHEFEKKQHIDSLTAQLDTLVQASASGSVDPKYQQAVSQQIDELQDEISGKKSKGGFHISNLIGRFQDTGREPNQKQAQGGPPNRAAAQGPPPRGMEAFGGSQSAGTSPTAGPQPTRGSFGEIMAKGIIAPSQQQIEMARTIWQNQTDDDRKENQRKITEGLTWYLQTHPDATQKEKQTAAWEIVAGITKIPIARRTRPVGQPYQHPDGSYWQPQVYDDGQPAGEVPSGPPRPGTTAYRLLEDPNSPTHYSYGSIENGKVVSLIPNAPAPTGSAPTLTKTQHILKDPNTGAVYEYTTESVRTKLGAGPPTREEIQNQQGAKAGAAQRPTKAAKPATGGTPSKLTKVGQLTPRLTTQAKQALETIQTGMGMIDRLEEAVKPLAEGNPLAAKGRVEIEWAKYMAGFQVDPPYDYIIPTAALLRTMLTTPYLRGLRNFNYVQQIQQHLPSPTDTPQLILEKIAQLRQNIPLLVKAINEVEGAPSGGPAGAEDPLGVWKQP